MKQFDEIVFAVSNNGGIVVNVVFWEVRAEAI
jgi:hypothetical protein